MEPTETPAPTPPSFAPWILGGLALAAAALAAVAVGDASRARVAAEQARAESQAAAKAAEQARAAADRGAAEVAALRGDLELLITNVDAVQRHIKELADAQTFGSDNPFATDTAQPVIEFTPELRESLRKAVAAKGVELLEDRVVVPGRFILRQGALEFLAVLPGGKQHESILLLEGKPQGEDQRVEGLGAAINSCLQAIGLRPGTPIRLLPGGRTIPAKGSPVHIALEWEEEGKSVRVRAEDLLWDRERNRAMESGKFIYVGAWFDPEGYVPDLSGDAVAVYSIASTIIDLDDPRAANDTVFLPCTPRIPAEGTPVNVVFSAKPLEPTRTWSADEPGMRTDPGAPIEPPAPGEGGGGK